MKEPSDVGSAAKRYSYAHAASLRDRVGFFFHCDEYQSGTLLKQPTFQTQKRSVTILADFEDSIYLFKIFENFRPV